MKNMVIAVAFFLATGVSLAQVLEVNQVIQEKDQWCWAATSKCVLDYFGFVKDQCELAEYTRSVNIANEFGSVDCCEDADQGCNNPNYMFDATGSLDDILNHFGGLITENKYDTISSDALQTEFANLRPVIARWGWYTGGGHFLVLYGIEDGNVYYMNPWFGEGKKISTYKSFVDDGTHIWTHSIYRIIGVPPNSVTESGTQTSPKAYPNPTSGVFSLESPIGLNPALYDYAGNRVECDFSNPSQINVSYLPAGAYFIRLTDNRGTNRILPLVITK